MAGGGFAQILCILTVYLCSLFAFCAALLIVLFCHLVYNSKPHRAAVEYPSISRSVDAAEYILIYRKGYKDQFKLPLGNLIESALRQTLSECLECYGLLLTTPHDHRWKFHYSASQVHVLNFKPYLYSDILSSSSPKVLVAKFKARIPVYDAAGHRRNNTGGIKQYVGSLGLHRRLAAKYSGLFGFLSRRLSCSSLLFQVGQGSETNPDGKSGHDYQEPIRPKGVSPRWQWALLRRVLGGPLLLVGWWLRWNHRCRTVSLITFILGWCLLLGPSLPERDTQQSDNQDISVMHGR